MRLLSKTIVVALLLAGGVYFYLHSTSSSSTKQGKEKTSPPVPVLATTAKQQDMPIVLDLVGRGEAFESVSVMARIDGQVRQVMYRQGQRVRTGDVLVRLDPSDFDARLKQAEAAQARDAAVLKQAEAQVVRYQALKQQGFVSDEKLSDLRATSDADAATVKADRANVEFARLQASYATLRAPIDGIVGAQLVFPGTAVKTNETVLAVINRVQPLRVAFALPESHLDEVREALAQGTLSAMIKAPGSDGPGIRAKVNFIDNAVDATTGTAQMKAVLDNADGLLAPGQYLRVALIVKTLKDAVVVPDQAVQQGPSGTVVYVVNPDQGITIRKVVVGTSRGGLSAIASGVAAGETVITDGHLKLTPTSKVKIGGDTAGSR